MHLTHHLHLNYSHTLSSQLLTHPLHLNHSQPHHLTPSHHLNHSQLHHLTCSHHLKHSQPHHLTHSHHSTTHTLTISHALTISTTHNLTISHALTHSHHLNHSQTLFISTTPECKITAGHWPISDHFSKMANQKFQHGAFTLYTWPIKFIKNWKKTADYFKFLILHSATHKYFLHTLSSQPLTFPPGAGRPPVGMPGSRSSW